MKKIKHLWDLNDVIPTIHNDINTIRENVAKSCNVNLQGNDVRQVALNGVQQVMFSTLMWINTGVEFSKSLASTDVLLQKIRSDADFEKTNEIMSNHLRYSFLLLIHFKFDNLFYQLLEELNSLPNRGGYWNISKELLRVTHMPNSNDKFEILQTFAFLRNSFHGNGVHNRSELHKTIGTSNYDFVRGKKIECSSWNHIIDALVANIDIVEKILLSTKITTKLNYEIPDTFASS